MTTLGKYALVNASIITMDPERPEAEAVAWKGGRIVAVGKEGKVLKAVPGAKKLDADGRTVVPGFIDCHTHFLSMGVWAGRLPLAHTTSANDVLQVVKKRAKEMRKGQWVLGRGWDEAKWSDTKYLTKKDLDRAAPDNPVLLIRVCGHMCVVNSKALAALQGKVGSDGLDEKHGHLKERALERALELSRPTIQEMAAGLERSTLMAHRLGVTSVHDIINRHKLQAYGAMYAKRALGVRAYLHFEEPDLPEMAKLGISTGYGTHFFRAGGIKLYADGSFGARTAALSEPYYDDRTTKGELLHDAQKLRGLIRAGEKAGLQMLVHAIGDLAVSQTVSSYAMALMKPSKLRHRIEHLELVDDDSLAMMRRLCVWASMQPNFVGEWGHPGGMMATRLGTRYERADAMKKVLSAGIPLIFGSDCMPFTPLYGIHSAVNAPFKDQRLTVEEALRAYTATAAAASFEEDFKGSLAPEKAADMVILGSNPLEQPGGIKDITVDATVLAGKFVWKRPGTMR